MKIFPFCLNQVLLFFFLCFFDLLLLLIEAVNKQAENTTALNQRINIQSLQNCSLCHDCNWVQNRLPKISGEEIDNHTV